VRDEAEQLLAEAPLLTEALTVMIDAPPSAETVAASLEKAAGVVTALRAVRPTGSGEPIDRILEQRDFDELKAELGPTAKVLEAAINALREALAKQE
jgi:hypothetical protein